MPNFFELAIRFVNLLVYALTAAIFLRAIFPWVRPARKRQCDHALLAGHHGAGAGPPAQGAAQHGDARSLALVAMILLQVMGSIVTQTLLPLAR